MATRTFDTSFVGSVVGWLTLTPSWILLLPQALQLQSLKVLALSTYYFHLLRSWMHLIQFFIFNFFMSFLMSSSHPFFGLPCGRIDIGFHLYTFFFTILSSGIRCKWPNQLNRCDFMWFIIFLCLINSSNSSFVLILHVPSLSFVGPKIFLNTYLSNTVNLFFMVSFKTHTSQAIGTSLVV